MKVIVRDTQSRSYWLNRIEQKRAFIAQLRKEDDQEYEDNWRHPKPRWWGWGTPLTHHPDAKPPPSNEYPSQIGWNILIELNTLENALKSHYEVILSKKNVNSMTTPN